MAKGKVGHRREERIRAFRILYGLSFHPPRDADHLDRLFVASPDPDSGVYPDGFKDATASGFAWELAAGVWRNREELDTLIEKFSQHWRVGRIAKVELAILRLALYEMLHRPDVPTKVAINEAVETAKEFGDENSKSFVNGILDAAAKAFANGEIGIH